jgi:hypothetical protein
MVNQNILILRPKFNIFWAIFIRLFLTFNTSGENIYIIKPRQLRYWSRSAGLNDANDIISEQFKTQPN